MDLLQYPLHWLVGIGHIAAAAASTVLVVHHLPQYTYLLQWSH